MKSRLARAGRPREREHCPVYDRFVFRSVQSAVRVGALPGLARLPAGPDQQALAYFTVSISPAQLLTEGAVLLSPE